MIFRRLTLFLTILFVIPFAKSASGDSKPEAKAQTEHAFIYKVIKTFELTPPVEMDSLQFKYPLAKKELQGQTTFDLSTDPNYNALITDPDGNEIAIFYFSKVPAGRIVTVRMDYTIKIENNDISVDPAKVSADYSKDTELVKGYLGNEGGLNINNESIRSASAQIVQKEENPYLKGKAIYDYICRNISYENVEDVSGWQAPDVTLRIKRGNCNAITKLFISLARASGLPAREVVGVVFCPTVSEKKSIADSSHAWAEIYLPGYGWLPVDATFGISQKDKYYCFNNTTHIKEVYGQLVSRNPGSLYRGSSIEGRTYSTAQNLSFGKKATIEIDLVSKY
jgi:hypothetical protein